MTPRHRDRSPVRTGSLVLLATFVLLLAGCRRDPSQRERSARKDLKLLAAAWQQYLAVNTNDAAALHTVSLGMLQQHLPPETLIPITDPWGRPYRRRERDGRIEVFSIGPDRTLGTQDDLVERVPGHATRRRTSPQE